MAQNLWSYSKNHLRCAWRFYSPEREEALALARVGNKYKCAKDGKLHKLSDVEVDHINPVISLDNHIKGKVRLTREIFLRELSLMIDRLFCPLEGLQVLCEKHHDEKSAWEREERKRLKPPKTTDKSKFKRNKTK